MPNKYTPIHTSLGAYTPDDITAEEKNQTFNENWQHCISAFWNHKSNIPMDANIRSENEHFKFWQQIKYILSCTQKWASYEKFSKLQQQYFPYHFQIEKGFCRCLTQHIHKPSSSALETAHTTTIKPF